IEPVIAQVSPRPAFAVKAKRYCLTTRMLRVRVAGSSPVGLRVRRTWRLKEIDLLLRREGTSRNGWQPTADALLTMYFPRQPVAAHRKRFWLVSAVPSRERFAADCHWLRPPGSITAPSLIG